VQSGSATEPCHHPEVDPAAHHQHDLVGPRAQGSHSAAGPAEPRPDDGGCGAPPGPDRPERERLCGDGGVDVSAPKSYDVAS
jgi:hypothetical protein